MDKILGYIEAGKNEGAELLTGGARHGGPIQNILLQTPRRWQLRPEVQQLLCWHRQGGGHLRGSLLLQLGEQTTTERDPLDSTQREERFHSEGADRN